MGFYAFNSTSIASIKAEPIELHMNIITLLIFFVSGLIVYHFLMLKKFVEDYYRVKE
jgi:hypothetical protein